MLRIIYVLFICSLSTFAISGQIEGMVMDTMGQPQNDVAVVLVDVAGTKQMTYTDPGGYYQFTKLPGGNYVLYLVDHIQPTVSPYCGVTSISLQADQIYWQDFTLKTTNGVIVDFGKPAGGGTGGGSSLPHQFFFKIYNGPAFTNGNDPLPDPKLLSIRGFWQTGNGDPVDVTVTGISHGIDYTGVNMNLSKSNPMVGQSTLMAEIMDANSFETDGTVLYFDFTIGASAWTDLAAAANVLCFCADDIKFYDETGGFKIFQDTICTQVTQESAGGGTGRPGDDGKH